MLNESVLSKMPRGSIALVWVFLAAPCFAQTGPVGRWSLDEGTGSTTADASGNADTGTLTNSPTWSTGRVGPYALSFTGGTQSVAVNGSGVLANLYTTHLTVTAWIKPAGLGGGSGGRIVDKDNNDQGWFFCLGLNNTLKFQSDQFSTTQPNRTSASSTIALNSWQHVAATWDGSALGSGIHLYINGIDVSAAGTSANGSGTALSDTTTPLTIGNRPVDNARGFNGLIDEVRVYNRILSAAEIQALADSTAPGAPTGLNLTAVSSTQINVSWTAPTDNVAVTGYLLERCTGASCSNFAQIATPTTTSYSNTGLTASTSYTYRVRATDANSNLGSYSSPPVSITTPAGGGGDTQVPTAPSNLMVVASSSSEIDLSWGASTDNVGVTGYSVERCSGASCTPVPPGTATNGPPYFDTGLTAGTAYSYRVRATDAAGNWSTYSNVLTLTTAASSPDCN